MTGLVGPKTAGTSTLLEARGIDQLPAAACGERMAARGAWRLVDLAQNLKRMVALATA